MEPCLLGFDFSLTLDYSIQWLLEGKEPFLIGILFVLLRFYYSWIRFWMNSRACSRKAKRRVPCGLLWKDVSFGCFSLFLLDRQISYGPSSFTYIWFILLLVVSASLKSKLQKRKLSAAGESIEYRCLIRATDAKKTISTSVCVLLIDLNNLF